MLGHSYTNHVCMYMTIELSKLVFSLVVIRAESFLWQLTCPLYVFDYYNLYGSHGFHWARRG